MSLPRYPIRVLITGTTGFIGGTLLQSILGRQDYQHGQVEIACLVRGEDRAALIRREFGVHVIMADLADVDVIEAAAAQADVVIDTANADHPRSCRAILAGLKMRHAHTGIQSIFIHSSGTGALTDNAQGEFASEKIYEDFDCGEIRAIPRNYVHREGDSMISEASEEGYIRGYVVMPPLVYGRGTGPFSRTSVQIPALIRAALKLGQSIHVGPGRPMWNGVHVQDLVDLYLILMDDALSGRPKAPTGLECYYFCATDTYSWKQLADELGKRLYARGAIATAESRAVSSSEEEEVLGAWSRFAYGSNSRSKAGKAYTLGWKPKHHTTGLFESIDEEYDAVLEEGKHEAPKVHIDEMNKALGSV
ncbi:Epimerase domain-containing protein [Mycena sanguinolenta]|uniref:Epimerase domain-containing protein n=1 Tax=Mycena sanguinolenta TaxID=230812 RepID=A0A8H7DK55_9AGAR|nr:Epimerase domain-containing protein [Mycena sanguinolenta]